MQKVIQKARCAAFHGASGRRPLPIDTNPDNAQQVAPSNESRTQVAVNDEGKTNEATKNLKEPLQKGQTAPKDGKQQQQQDKPQKKNGKGMKM